MKKYNLVISILCFSSMAFADLRNGTPTTLPLMTPTTVACVDGSNNCGVLPVATATLQKQKSAMQSLTPFITGGLCIYAAIKVTSCMEGCLGGGAVVCCAIPTAACIGLAMAINNSIKSASNQTQAAIDATNGVQPTQTNYNLGPTPTPGPTDSGVTVTNNNTTRTGVVKLKDGRSYNLKDLGNDAAMAKAGFSAQEIKDTRAIAAVLNKAVVSGVAAAGSDKGDSMFGDGLGAGSGKSANLNGEINPDTLAAERIPSSNVAAAKAEAVGLAMRCGDSMCGTANDGIFTMINRQSNRQCEMNAINCK